VRFDEAYMLSRYDAVLHLDTAAKGAEAHYKHGETVDDSGRKVFRHETPAMARAADDQMLAVWAAHPRVLRVRNGPGGFAAKLRAVVDGAMAVALAKHPQ
jgi:hypothetical protein